MGQSTTSAAKLSFRQRLRQTISPKPAASQTSILSQSLSPSPAQNVWSRSSSVSTALSVGQPSNDAAVSPSSQQHGPSICDPPRDLLERALQCLPAPERTILGDFFGAPSTDIHLAIGEAIAAVRDKRQDCLDKRWTLALAGRQIVLREEADKVIAWLDHFRAVGDIMANADPVHVGLPWAGIRLLLKAATAESDQMACLLLGCETILYMTSRLKVYTDFMGSIPSSPARANLEESIITLYAHILHFVARAIHVCQSSMMQRLRSAFGYIDDITSFETKGNTLAMKVELDASNCGRLLELKTLQQELYNLAQLRSLQVSLDRLHLKFDLSKIPYAKGAIFNSADSVHILCHPHTRVDLLDQIQQWARKHDSKNIFWLHGAAGAGKSTISWTLAQWLVDQGGKSDVDLGASFFFRRGEGDRGSAARFFPTVVRQLILKIPGLEALVAKVVEQDPFIFDKALGEQFRRLLKQPLQNIDVPHTRPSTLVVVVDALDECENDGDIETILQLWPEVSNTRTSRIRLFLTSRPELPIRSRFRQMPTNLFDDLVLQDAVPKNTIEQDLLLYLKERFASIREQDLAHCPTESTLNEDWPGSKMLNRLVDLSTPLFIVAATVCRFVGDPDFDPSERLGEVVSSGYTGPMAQMKLTYLPVLNHLTNSTRSVMERKTLCQEFRDIVGSIVCLAEPLSAVDLATLLNKTVPSIMRRLSPLHSVLRIPADQLSPIRPLHLSFTEFLLDSNLRDEPFGIDGPYVHSILAVRCLQLLSQPDGLRENILNLDSPGQLRQDVNSVFITNKLSVALQYACQYWVHHALSSEIPLTDDSDAHNFLRVHYLHWLEALSFMGRISQMIGFLDILKSVTPATSIRLSLFLEDARRFILTNRRIIDLAPLQIYLSAIIFAPRESLIRQCATVPEWVAQHPNISSAGWGPERQKLEGHTFYVWAVAFSRDDRMLASASFDFTVRLWSTNTGQEIQKLEGHAGRVWSVAFSYDNKLLASASDDQTICLWDPSTGLRMQVIEVNSETQCVAFSQVSPLLAFGSADNTIRIWNTSTAREIHKLEGHTGEVRSVSFRGNNSFLASAALDGTVRLWNPSTSKEMQRLGCHSTQLPLVAISSNGMLLASSSDTDTVRLWDVSAALQLHELDGHDNFLVTSIAFSPDGLMLASASDDCTVLLWNPGTGEMMSRLVGHTGSVHNIAFSYHSSLLASAGSDRTVRLWEIPSIEGLQMPDEEVNEVDEILYYSNGSLLASKSSASATVCIWNSFTGQMVRELRGHSSGITRITISHDDLLLASASFDRVIHVWDLSSGKLLRELRGHKELVNTLTFSHSDHMLASGSNDMTIIVWDILAGNEMQRLEGHGDWVIRLSFSYDDSMIVSASIRRDRSVRIWSLSTGQEVQKITEMSEDMDWVSAVAISQDGTLLALVSRSTYEGPPEVRLWDLSASKLLLMIESAGWITRVSFTPNNDWLLTERGAINIKTQRSSTTKQNSDIFSTVFAKHDWVTCQEADVLWIPHDYRKTVAVHGNMIAFGQRSGLVGFIRIDPDLFRD